MLKLELKINNGEKEVFCEGVKLIINKQASKGEGKECVKVEGLEGSNGQKWVSLSKLNEGINEIETQGREVSVCQKYTLTEEEKAEIEEYQAKINAIIDAAKARYVAVPKAPKDISKLNNLEKEKLIEQYTKYLENLRASK